MRLMRLEESTLLTKVLNIEGVGLLRNVKGGNNTPFRPVTLIYAENGRGKSTFASLLNSCALRNSNAVEDRVTIDADVKPAAKLMFGNSHATYKDGAWSGFTPDVIVYDGNFVTENVHTGSEVTSSQRANLLDFALGKSAVQARQVEALATENEQAASQEVKQLRAKLENLVGGVMPLPSFRALAEDPDIEKKITETEQKLVAATRSTEIRRQPTPQEQKVPTLDVSRVFEVLKTTLEDVHAQAAARVAEHLSHLTDTNSSDWVQKGLELQSKDNCPFCGQDVSQVELLEMYRIYFNDEYANLKEAVDSISTEALNIVDPGIIGRLTEARARNNEVIQQWSEFVPITSLEDEPDALALVSLENLRDLLESLFTRKFSAITEAHGSEAELAEVERLWAQVREAYADENIVIRGYRSSIETYKQSLESTTIDEVKDRLERLRVEKLRFASSTMNLIGEAKTAEETLKDAERQKKLREITLAKL